MDITHVHAQKNLLASNTKLTHKFAMGGANVKFQVTPTVSDVITVESADNSLSSTASSTSQM